MENYLEQAKNFLTKTNTTFSIEFVKTGKYFSNDKEVRDIYKFTLKRGNRTYTSEFGQSLNDSGSKLVDSKGQMLRSFSTEIMISDKVLRIVDGVFKCDSASFNYRNSLKFRKSENQKLQVPTMPNEYSVLACLTKYDPDTFENFCDEFGYSTDSKNAEKIYNGVCKEYMGVCSLWNDDEIDELMEIN